MCTETTGFSRTSFSEGCIQSGSCKTHPYNCANVFCALVKNKSGSAGISTARCFMAAGGVTGDFSQMRRLLQSTMKSLSPRPATQAVTLPDWAVSGTDELKHLNSCYSK